MASGNLHIINVNSTDQGQYTCTASNHITGELIDGQRILKLVVKAAPMRTKPATIIWQPEERYISQIGKTQYYNRIVSPENNCFIYIIGHNVTLECAVTGWPKPQIRWFRNGNLPLPVGRSHYLGEAALVITGLMDQDEGGYICEASNAAGPPIRYSTLVQLTEPVSIIKSPKDARVEEGSRVGFDCFARGRPPPQHYWVFNGNALNNDTNVIISGTYIYILFYPNFSNLFLIYFLKLIADQQLTILNVTKRHAGIFQCFVSNSLSKVDGGAVTLEVVPRSKVGSSISSVASLTSFSEEDDDSDLDLDSFFDEKVTQAPSKPEVDRKNGKKGSKHRPKGIYFNTKIVINEFTYQSTMYLYRNDSSNSTKHHAFDG